METVAIIGSGIAGLGSAWLLKGRYEVHLFEAGNDFGGHTNTITVDEGAHRVPVDTGFIVYNEKNYPNLTALFAELEIATHPTVMSFGVTVDNGRIEYAGSNLNTLFAQRRNLARPGHWKMLGEILRFNTSCKELLGTDGFARRTLGDFLHEEGYSISFRDYYLLPMAAAIWSCPTRAMLEFPLESFAHFFRNHGLLDIRNRPQWRSVLGGSRNYVERILDTLGGRAACASPVRTVIRAGNKRPELLFSDGGRRSFDRVIVATHADQALRLLDAPTPQEAALLGSFRYQSNRAFLHSDPSLMPRARRVWSAWNYLAGKGAGMTDRVSVTYWMNRLQRLDARRDYFVSLNPLQAPDRFHAAMTYEHPVFDADAIAAQPRLGEIQGKRDTWFCGSYFGYGFHEDALSSAVAVASHLGVKAPWHRDRASEAA
jgi:uncharacterized protein